MTVNKLIRILSLATLAMCLGIGSARAAQEQDGEVDVQAIVFEHLGDSYYWHITDIGEKQLIIHLPVIARSGVDGRWHVFSSRNVYHGHEYEGFTIASHGDLEGKLVEVNTAGEWVRPSIDISITKNVLGLFINCAVLMLIILPLAGWYRKHKDGRPPKGFLGAVDMLLMDIQDEVIKPSVGEGYQKYSSYLLMLFFFIFVNNLMGLIPFIPGGVNITGNIAITMILALSVFLVIQFSGTKEYWKEIFWPDVPAWLKVPAPIMPLIEIFGVFTKPFALMIRLFANMMAGHAVIISLVCLIFITVSMGAAVNAGMSVVAVVFAIFMNCVELLVAYIQAYVFTLLAAVFIGMARVKHEHN